MSEWHTQWVAGLRQAAWAEEAPVLRRLVQEALEKEPSAAGLAKLAVGASLCQPEGDQALAPQEQQGIQERIRWGLEQRDPQVRWDALHVAAELGEPLEVPSEREYWQH